MHAVVGSFDPNMSQDSERSESFVDTLCDPTPGSVNEWHCVDMTKKVSVHKKLCFSWVGPPVETLNGRIMDVVFSGVRDGKHMVDNDYIDNNEVVRFYFNSGSVITGSSFAKGLIVCTYDDLHNNQIEVSLDSGHKYLFKKQTFTMGSADDNDVRLDKAEAGPNDMTVTMMQGGTFQVKVHSTKGIMVNGAVVTESIVAESGLVLENLDKQYKITVCWFENGRYNRPVSDDFIFESEEVGGASSEDSPSPEPMREDSPSPEPGDMQKTALPSPR